MTFYDTIIVGAGMMGSAAAYHSKDIGGKVALIGPNEPINKEQCNYHGAWHDEGRLYTSGSSDPVWGELARRSFLCFDKLEKESGMKIISRTGCCYFTKDESEFKEVMVDDGNGRLPIKEISENYQEIFPYLQFPPGAKIGIDERGGGHLSPRRMVQALQKMSTNVTRILDIVVKIQRPKTGDKSGWEIVAESQQIYCCKNVLLCAGSYSIFNNLFEDVKPGYVPDLELRTQTVLYIEIDRSQSEKYESMPSMFADIRFRKLDGMYLLPPIEYPDGKIYIKIGHGRHYEKVLTTFDQVKTFYKQGPYDKDCLKDMEIFVRHLVPDLTILSTKADGCLTAHTPTEHPYIEKIADGFAVCFGGNGHAAKSSYEIGRLAIELTCLGKWDNDINTLEVHWKKIN